MPHLYFQPFGKHFSSAFLGFEETEGKVEAFNQHA